MKQLALALAFLAFASDSNRLSKEDAQRYAKVCVEQAASKVTDAQIAIEANTEKPCATRGEGGGAMVVPDKKLTLKAMETAGKDVVPIGQLWLRKWKPVAEGKAVADDKLRVVMINVEGKDRPMPLLLLGVRKKGDRLELVGYGKESEPVLVLPLKKVDFVEEAIPIEMDWERGDKFDRLAVRILGKFATVIEISR
jgi:hypothetical protein